uniref:Probable transcription termination protein NusA n=3 Tax=Thermofilum pendens TaxID=2269 RepID=A0A7J3X857_THEPE
MKPGGIRLTDEELQLMRVFEEITRIVPKDCIFDELFNRYIFVVGKGQASLAVGRNGVKVRLLRGVLKRDVEVVEEGESVEELVKSALFPAKVAEIVVHGNEYHKVVVAKVSRDSIAFAIGRNGRNVHRARLLLRRYFNISDIRVVQRE